LRGMVAKAGGAQAKRTKAMKVMKKWSTDRWGRSQWRPFISSAKDCILSIYILCYRQPSIYITLSTYRWCFSTRSCSRSAVLLYRLGLLNVPSIACDCDCMRLHGDSFVGLASFFVFFRNQRKHWQASPPSPPTPQ
jgi:hypothetical protein